MKLWTDEAWPDNENTKKKCYFPCMHTFKYSLNTKNQKKTQRCLQVEIQTP